MTCEWCPNSIRVCPVQNCRGWNGEPCSGYMHGDLFHGCRGGAHQAEPARTTANGTRAAQIAAQTGKPKTAETRDKISTSLIGNSNATGRRKGQALENIRLGQQRRRQHEREGGDGNTEHRAGFTEAWHCQPPEEGRPYRVLDEEWRVIEAQPERHIYRWEYRYLDIGELL